MASVGPRTKGRGMDGLVHGDLEDHTNWNLGIRKALKFMQSPITCPTQERVILRIQRKQNKKQKQGD